jgi:DNA helicase II / ATP-dependent DNA helicase PcrA
MDALRSPPPGKQQTSLASTELDVAGRYLVIAGPGAGKTSLLVKRVQSLMANGELKDQSVLVLTFTSKAAAEVSDRLGSPVEDVGYGPVVGTFHAFGSRVLHAHGDVIGIPTNFVQYTGEDQQAVVRDLQRNGALPSNLTAHDLLRAIAHEKELACEKLAAGMSRDSVAAEWPDYVRVYQKALREVRALDFSDLIRESIRLFAEAPHVLDLYRSTYTHVLVDEFQDTTPGQFALLKQLVSDATRSVFAVADEDQLIFEWNEARLDTLNRYCDVFRPDVVYATLSFRCPPRIVLAANEVIRRNRFRFPDKPDIRTDKAEGSSGAIKLVLPLDEEDEASQTTVSIERLIASGVAPSEVAVIGRAGWVLDRVETKLTRAGVLAARPTFGGLGDSEEADAAVRLFRWILNEWDEQSVRKVLAFFLPELSDSAERAFRSAHEKGISSEAALINEPSLAGSSDLRELIRHVSDLRQLSANASRMLNELSVRAEPFLVGLVRSETVGREVRRIFRSLSELAKRLFPRREVAVFEFLMSIPSMTSMESLAATGSAVSLLTCHQAKGTGFPYVFILGLEEGLFPDYRQTKSVGGIEAERRLFYVALTRTITQVTMSSCKTRSSFSGLPRARERSRFIGEITPELMEIE